MKFPKINYEWRSAAKWSFIIILILIDINAFLHYLCWTPSPYSDAAKKFLGHKAFGIALTTTRYIESHNFLPLLLLTVGVSLTIYRKKFFWYPLSVVISIVAIIYLDERAYYSPN